MTRSSEAPGLRETILAISGELLNEGGPASLSMREVSRRAGCTHQAPYHHFKSREGILAALITEGFLALEKSLSEALRASANATPQ
ncbi:MAG: TetR/AcrR family transcriptional regulator, partial [Actinomyces sp.]|uniref:TetR/AcrR family transcriptional regulator n=1 Tax=Actinomyces sp. TaxID=29317 RepID=UPI0025E7EC67